MYLKYGTYTHDTGECQLAISRKPEFNDAQIPWAVRERWDISGLLLNTTGVLATMQTKIASLVNAYDADGYDLILYLPDNSASQHQLLTANCLGGTKVVSRVSFPTNRGAAEITYVDYTVSVEGIVPVGSETLMSFTESVTFNGGGRLHGHIETLIGLPVKQTLRRHTIFRATQSGDAVGLYAYPNPPAPLWPAALVRPDYPGTIRRRSPKRRAGGDTWEYPVTWQYEFESSTVMIGNPTRW